MERLGLRIAIRVATLLAAVIMVVCGLGFLCFAAYLALLDRVSPPIAALIAAAAAFVLAGMIILLGRALVLMIQRRQRHDADRLAESFREILGDELVSLATENPHATLLTSLCTGFAVGAVPELRHVLRDLLRGR
jgi:hypothetical protein